MIVAMSILYLKGQEGKFCHLLSTAISYDVKSADDAKKEYLSSDECIAKMNDGYAVMNINALVLNEWHIVKHVKDMAKKFFDEFNEIKRKAEEE